MKGGWPTQDLIEGGTAAGRFDPPPIEELTDLFPQLEILELIGRGGMGAVYKARHPELDRLVALKILAQKSGVDPGFTERFSREAKALARLSHPNIVAVHDFGQAGVYSYFLMEYVDGRNLRQIEQAGRLAPSEALEIIPQICSALQFAHDAGVVHRDIKPENVLLDQQGQVKIADFGLAKIMGQTQPNFTLTEPNHVMGTPHYMAPEQVEHPSEVDHRADIYSLGVVFYEMLTGELPLGRFAPPSRKVQVDVRLDEVVLRALEKEPECRYQQAGQVKAAVERISREPHAKADPETSAVQEADREAARGRLTIPAIGLAIAGITDFLSFLFLMLSFQPLVEDISRGTLTVGRQVNLLPLVFAGLFGICTVVGAYRMSRLRGYGLAVIIGILVMMIPPGFVLGLPFGIWSLIVLARRDTREAFKAVAQADLARPRKERSMRTVVIGGGVLVVVLAALLLAQLNRRYGMGQFSGQLVPIKSFPSDTRPLDRGIVTTPEQTWLIDSSSAKTWRLFEVSDPNVAARRIIYRARIKTEEMGEGAYLEMWCRFPGSGEYFSRALNNVVTGTTDWISCQTPFLLKSGQRPDLIRLNLVTKGSGKVWIRDVELLRVE